jgi:hypothetical protein
VPANAVTVFSAHGVAREVEADAGARELHVLNATRPLVTTVHIPGPQARRRRPRRRPDRPRGACRSRGHHGPDRRPSGAGAGHSRCPRTIWHR